jgi:glutaredoxin 3
VVSESAKPKSVRLFVKPWCPWCDEAADWLEERGIAYEKLNVLTNAAARQEMRELSGQTLAPVIDVDGQILADFDTDQLAQFWKRFESTLSE